jgi:copper transport protein
VVRRALAALAVAAVVAGALPAAAGAHAMLERTTPQRGAQLAHPPKQVTFGFDESVNASLGAVKVFDGRGHEVQAGAAFHPGGRGADVAVRLPAHLANGSYTATYRVISADSHPVSGGFSFTVGPASAAGAGTRSVDALLRGQTAGPVTDTAFSVVRGVQYAAIALGLGTLVFLLVCWLPALAEVGGGGTRWWSATHAFARRIRTLLVAAAVAGAISAILAIGLEGAQGEGASLWSSLHRDVLGDVLATRFGAAWLGALVAWLLVGAGVLVAPASVPVLRPASVGATGLALPRSRGTLLVLAVPLAALAFLPAFSGHAAVQSPVALLLPANVIHVASMSAWLGGIAVLVLALRAATTRLEPEDRTPLLVATVGRFSAMAGIAFAVLLASGVAQGIVEVASVPALVTTAFGRAVLIKLVLFCVLVGFGWVNRSRVLPALRAAGGSPARAGVLLRRTLRSELCVGVAVIGVTGALAGYAPSTTATSGPVSREADVGPAHLQATVDPARVGHDQMHLYLFDRRTGAQFAHAKQVTVTAALPDKGIDDLPFHVRLAGPGHFIGAGMFGVSGDWTLTVTVRVSAFDEYVTHLTVPIR